MTVLAGLYRAVEAQTPYGGRSVTFEPAGSAWLKCGARRRQERGSGDERHAVETMTAEARADARLAVGRRLRLGGADWAIVTVEPTRPGRAKLGLERVR
ncbi:phage head-tail adapter protein [Brevundimonas albigilva]|uniref:Phage head-tail adapter protein n=1 Tax=Brevundimonas albigilva TaxID=1312364 RepID=A0ABY4SPI1_9CAUL|nr:MULTISPECIES: phage head-tail adapter protein [Brevundimonas]UQV19271.1 phage head-tail adapter protein [Brevundimonas albigilva]URI15814.1 phage head-tail adapter protein [Brevundimonas albigilva]